MHRHAVFDAKVTGLMMPTAEHDQSGMNRIIIMRQVNVTKHNEIDAFREAIGMEPINRQVASIAQAAFMVVDRIESAFELFRQRAK